MSWMDDLKRLQSKPKMSSAEVNEYIITHPNWAANIIRNALNVEMYQEFCLGCKNFDCCYQKLGTVKRETDLGCICNEFMNQDYSKTNQLRLREYFKLVSSMLGF
ncbi:MAG: hypothetical protein NUK63_04115 [Candidatus Bathyarchaeum tardum]|nr:MAG: hypothetical protein NUK63_04115 [Candidatus Bathyarchaeum tardum]